MEALRFRPHQRQRGRGSRGLKSDGKKHHVFVGIDMGKLERVGWRINNADIHPAGFVFKRTSLCPRNSHHVAKGRKDDIRLLRDR